MKKLTELFAVKRIPLGQLDSHAEQSAAKLNRLRQTQGLQVADRRVPTFNSAL